MVSYSHGNHTNNCNHCKLPSILTMLNYTNTVTMVNLSSLASIVTVGKHGKNVYRINMATTITMAQKVSMATVINMETMVKMASEPQFPWLLHLTRRLVEFPCYHCSSYLSCQVYDSCHGSVLSMVYYICYHLCDGYPVY